MRSIKNVVRRAGRYRDDVITNTLRSHVIRMGSGGDSHYDYWPLIRRTKIRACVYRYVLTSRHIHLNRGYFVPAALVPGEGGEI